MLIGTSEYSKLHMYTY